jgi:hypothetical protein
VECYAGEKDRVNQCEARNEKEKICLVMFLPSVFTERMQGSIVAAAHHWPWLRKIRQGKQIVVSRRRTTIARRHSSVGALG